MLTIDFGTDEYYDDGRREFIYKEIGPVNFEYSLKVIYDWEAVWKKPFLKGGLTDEETLDFYRRMALEPIDSDLIRRYDVIEALSKYIKDENTATTFSSPDEGQNGDNSLMKGKIYTAEELYALMCMNQVPLEFENRNFNRLLTVLRIIGSYNSPKKKMTREDIHKQNRELNRQRREQMKSSG